MKSLRILIVDDQPLNLSLLREQLETEGYTVLEAANGAEALATLDIHEVEFIISDILMPVMDGYRLCYEVRRNERHRHLPFIIYTASYVSQSDEQLGLDLGADRCLRKPAKAEQLLSAIEEVIASERRQPRAGLEATDVLKQYSERLVTKLENENAELTEAVQQLSLQTTALETAADAVLITDHCGVILWINPAFTTTTGYPADEVIGKTPRILRSGLHDQAFYRDFWDTILSGRAWRGEFANRRKDGTIYHDEHTVTPVRDSAGRITHFVGIMHEITERRNAEEQLRKALAQVREFIDHSPAALYALAMEGDTVRTTFVTENIGRLLGFDVSETISYEWWYENLHPEDRERAVASIGETISQGQSSNEYRVRHKEGGYRWIEDQRRMVRDEEGNPTELVGVWTDVTRRRLAQEGLHESERRFREMLDNLELVAIMLDRDGGITYCNEYFARMSGWTCDELLGVDWFDRFIPPASTVEMQVAFTSLINDASEVWHHTNEILTRSGEHRLVKWNNSVLRSPSGEIIGTASIGDDITDRRRLEEQFLRAQRLESLGTLAGGIAHDLNNLFMPILMGVTLLKRMNPDESTMKVITNIDRSVKRGTDLVKQVLLFARGSEGLKEPVSLEKVILEVRTIVESTFPKNISLNATISESLNPVIGDITQLSQVFMNLLVNARDAMPTGGRIIVNASNIDIDEHFARMQGGVIGGSYALVEVADEGTGMSKEVMDRIFEPFFTTKDVSKGTGLGLSTAQGIIRSHGGFIDVSSERGKGSVFRVYLPARAGDPALAAEGTDAEDLPRGNGELILVIDDEESILSITRETLETFGYSVLTARDGAQGIGLYSRESSRIAVVLTDMMMPVIDGAAVIAALREINPGVRVIAMSGHSEGRPMSGPWHLLSKPYGADLLLRTLSDVLSDSLPRQN